MCPMAHWNAFNMISGCEVVPGKKYAIRDPEYANSDHRPDWCPLVDVPPHGRLIDASEKIRVQIYDDMTDDFHMVEMTIDDLLSQGWVEAVAPTIIPAEEGE